MKNSVKLFSSIDLNSNLVKCNWLMGYNIVDNTYITPTSYLALYIY